MKLTLPGPCTSWLDAIYRAASAVDEIFEFVVKHKAYSPFMKGKRIHTLTYVWYSMLNEITRLSCPCKHGKRDCISSILRTLESSVKNGII